MSPKLGCVNGLYDVLISDKLRRNMRVFLNNDYILCVKPVKNLQY